MAGKHWTDDELAYIEYFVLQNDTKLADAAVFLGRSTRAIQVKLWRLRKSNNSTHYMHRLWTKKEEEFLKTHYNSMLNKDIAQRLCRTISAIEFRANKLGLKKHKDIKSLDPVIRELIKRGYYLSYICKELGIKMSSLIAHCQREGIEYKKKPRTEYDNYGKHVWNLQDQARFQKYIHQKVMEYQSEVPNDTKV